MTKQKQNQEQWNGTTKRRDFLNHRGVKYVSRLSCSKGILMLPDELKSEFHKRCFIYEQVAKDTLAVMERYRKGVGRDVLRFYTWRIKGEGSFAQKIEKKRISGNRIWSEIADILGFRLICLFKSQLTDLDSFVSNSFEVRSKQQKDSDEGYRSVHYIVCLKEKDCAESLQHSGEKYPFEIQCRTLLDDAWAGVSHLTAYKTGGLVSDIPINLELLSKYLSAADAHLEYVRDLYLRHRPLPEALEVKDLQGKDFSGQELLWVDFSGFNLKKANFREAKFIFCNLDDADLTEAILEKVDLSFAKMRRAKLINANLFQAQLSYADLTGAILNDSMLEKAMLAYSDLTDAKVWRAKMRYADLSFATLLRASFRKADLRNAHFIYNYDYESADFSEANLRGALIETREHSRKT